MSITLQFVAEPPSRAKRANIAELTERTCSRCEQTLPVSCFYSKKVAQCRDCCKLIRRERWETHREQILAKRKSQYWATPEKFRAERRESTARHRDEVNARQRAWWAEHGARLQVEKRLADPRGFRDRQLRKRYGITLKQYEEMLERQGGLCAICHEAPDTLHVDHCHVSGVVRGLLCNLCNVALGSFRDDAMLAYRAAHYLIGEVGDDGLTMQY